MLSLISNMIHQNRKEPGFVQVHFFMKYKRDYFQKVIFLVHPFMYHFFRKDKPSG